MFGLGMWEILIILGLALIFIGPKKLPEIAQSLGKGLREFRRATNDLKDSIDISENRQPPPYPNIQPNDDGRQAALPAPPADEPVVKEEISLKPEQVVTEDEDARDPDKEEKT